MLIVTTNTLPNSMKLKKKLKEKFNFNNYDRNKVWLRG